MRQLILGSLLVNLVLLPSQAGAQARPDGIYRAHILTKQGRGAVSVTGPSAPTWARLGQPMPQPTRHALYSVENGNTEYHYEAAYHVGQCRGLVLALSGQLIAATSFSEDRQNCSAGFSLSRSNADALSRSFGVQRRDRSALGGQIVSHFSTDRQSYSVGDSVQIRLRLSIQQGGTPIQHLVGGRNRGPRNNQFSFIVFRDGQQLAEIDGMDFGGLASYQTLRRGSVFDVSEQVERWADVSRPGRYRVECRYSTTLVPDGIDSWDAFQQGRVWDVELAGAVTFEVR